MEYNILDNVKRHEMFPTLVHEFSVDGLNDHDLLQMKMYIETNKEDKDLYQTSDDLHVLSFFQPFRDGILKITKGILDDLGYDYEGICITNMWGNIMRAGANHPPHTHSSNFLSGVYYLKAEGDTAPIQFFDPRVQSSILVPRRKTNNIYNSSMIQFDSVTEVGFIFPSWLQHWVRTNDKERMSVSWNIQVNGHYGEPHTLQNAYIKEK